MTSRKKGYNSNHMYDTITNKAEKTQHIYLSPFFVTTFNITAPRSLKQGEMIVNLTAGTGIVASRHLIARVRPVLRCAPHHRCAAAGAVVEVASFSVIHARLSRSKTFYYITAATLTAVIGVLLILFYVMKR